MDYMRTRAKFTCFSTTAICTSNCANAGSKLTSIVKSAFNNGLQVHFGLSYLELSHFKLSHFRLNKTFTCAVTVTDCGVNSSVGAGEGAFAAAVMARAKCGSGR
jgi:hypothetical protein